MIRKSADLIIMVGTLISLGTALKALHSIPVATPLQQALRLFKGPGTSLTLHCFGVHVSPPLETKGVREGWVVRMDRDLRVNR